MKITESQMKKFATYLEYGDKKELAKVLETTPQSISRYFKTMEMPRAKYIKMLAFIETLKNINPK